MCTATAPAKSSHKVQYAPYSQAIPLVTSTTPSPTAPIGVFDSGVGGLSILSGLRELLPHENLLYLADSRYAPYGPKGEDFVRDRSCAIVDFLLERGAKAIVVACNTATAAAIALLRERYGVPLIGVEPAIKTAAKLSQRGIVGVLATSGTIGSDKFSRLQDLFIGRMETLTCACPGLVELIEAPDFDAAAITALLEEFTAPIREKHADVLVLGCTHYSLIRDLIQQVMGADVRIVDTDLAVARETKRRLEALNALTPATQQGELHFFSSGDVAQQKRLLARYWGEAMEVEVF
jgi:glutamate racemase